MCFPMKVNHVEKVQCTFLIFLEMVMLCCYYSKYHKFKRYCNLHTTPIFESRIGNHVCECLYVLFISRQNTIRRLVHLLHIYSVLPQ